MNSVTLLDLPSETVLECKDYARQMVIKSLGERPKQSDYLDNTISEYPRWFVFGVVLFVAVVVGLLWLLSATKIFRLAYLESLHVIPGNGMVANMNGFILVLASELTVLVALISKRVLFEQKTEANRLPQRVLNGIALSATCLAVFSNIAVTRSHVRLLHINFANAPATLFVLLESLLPFFILGFSLILENLLLKSIRERQAALRKFNTDLQAFNAAVRSPETHPDYEHYLLKQVYELWLAHNASGQGKTARLQSIEAMSDAELESVIRAQLVISPFKRRQIEELPSGSGDAVPRLEPGNGHREENPFFSTLPLPLGNGG